MMEVKIGTKGNLMWIEPATERVQQVLESALTYHKLVRDNNSCGIQEEKLFELDESEGVFVSLAGLRQRAMDALTASGFVVKWTQHITKTFKAQDYLLSDEDVLSLGERKGQLEVIGLICDNPEGFVVEAATGWGKTYIIRQLCKMLPETRIAVVAPGADLANSIYEQMQGHIRDLGKVGDGSNVISRITVCTMESVSKLKGMEWDLLLCDEAHRAGADNSYRNIAGAFPTAKCVGFSASPEDRSDKADMRIEALFGPILYKVPYEDAVSDGAVVPINVVMYKIDAGPIVEENKPTLYVNRHGIWRNGRRNQVIADIVKSISPDDQLLITVATTEHGLYLRELLPPDFEFAFTTISNPHVYKALTRGTFRHISGMQRNKLSKERREELRHKFEAGTLKRCIATSVWNQGVNFKNLRYLIRADGLAAKIPSTQVPGRLSRTVEDKVSGTLIDFMDAFNKTLLGRSRSRLKKYRYHKWNISCMQVPLLPGEIANFSIKKPLTNPGLAL